MNAINKLLSEIKFQIPGEVLNIAFKEVQNYRNTVTSLDDKIIRTGKNMIVPFGVSASLYGGYNLYNRIKYKNALKHRIHSHIHPDIYKYEKLYSLAYPELKPYMNSLRKTEILKKFLKAFW